jgi:hypothetical protein
MHGLGTVRRFISVSIQPFPNECLNWSSAAFLLQLVAGRIHCPNVELSVCCNQRQELWARGKAAELRRFRGACHDDQNRVARVVTFAVCVPPVAVAHPHSHHAQTSHSSVRYGSTHLGATNGLKARDMQPLSRATFAIGAGRA